MSSTEVGRHTSLEPDKVAARATDQLVRAGLVVRQQDPRDRRRVILSLSAKGKQGFNDAIEEVRRAIEIELLTVLTPRELDALYAILDKLDERAATIFSESPAGRASWHARKPPRAPAGRSTAANASLLEDSTETPLPLFAPLREPSYFYCNSQLLCLALFSRSAEAANRRWRLLEFGYGEADEQPQRAFQQRQRTRSEFPPT